MYDSEEIRLANILKQILQQLKSSGISSRVWLNVEQVADYIGVSTNTIYQYRARGKIPFYKIPSSSILLFKREEIDRWIVGDYVEGERGQKAEDIANEIWDTTK